MITNLYHFRPLSRQLISLISSKQKQLQSSQQLSFLLPLVEEMSIKPYLKDVSWENLESLCVTNLSKKNSFNECEIESYGDSQRSNQQIIEQYNQFFKDVSNQIHSRRIQDLSEQTLQKHRIKIIPKNNSYRWKKLINLGSTYVELFSSGYKGIQCTYHVVISNFLLNIRVLNLDGNSLDQPQSTNEENVLGQGSYGKVQKLRVNKKNIAIKKIMFPKIKNLKFNLPQIFNSQDYAECYQIRRAITQYCIYKICSMFKIGPQVIFEKSYDLVCYNDCIEFEMEVCQEVSAQLLDNTYERDIKKCLGIMHSLKIIHKDVKKSNTLWSPSFKSFVLSDFGLSHSVKQNVWQKTQTFFGGSPSYSSPEMKKLLFGNIGSSGLVNLYLNDIHCLKVTLQNLKPLKATNHLAIYVQPSSQNSMSRTKRLYGSQSNQWQYVEYIDDEEKLEFVQQEKSHKLIQNEGQEDRIDEGCKTDIIRYYHVKVLYRFLQKYPKQLKNDCEVSIASIIEQTIPPDEQDYNQIRQEIEKVLIQDEKNFQCQVFSQILFARNSVRMFGVSSDEVNKLLEKIYQKKAIPNVCYNKIYNYLTASNKNNKIVVKQFKNHIMNMDQHRSLHNRRLFYCSLIKLIHNYLRESESLRKEEQKIEILNMGLQVLDFDQITEREFWQLVSLLWVVVGQGQNRPKNFQNQQCLNLVQKIFQILENKDRLNPIEYGCIVRIHLKCNSANGAEFYYKKIIQKRESLQQIINEIGKSVIIRTDQEIIDIREQILEMVKYQLAYLQAVNKHEQALNLGKFYYKFITENPVSDQIFTFNLLDKIIVSLMQLEKYAEAQEFNQVFSSVAHKLCFPKKTGFQISIQHYTKGILDYNSKNFREALRNFQKILQNPFDSLRGVNHVKLFKNTYTCMATCSIKLNEHQKALEYLQKNLQISLQYSQFNQFQQAIQIIHSIMPVLFKTNKSKPILIQYFEKLAFLKTQMINSKRIHMDSNTVKKLPFIPLQYLQSKKEQFGEDNIILIKKISISVVQQYLPTFKSWYLNTCQQLCLYYVNKINHPSKAIPYCRKIFSHASKNQLGQLIYTMMEKFADLLCRVNSTRKAYKFLKKNVYAMPIEFKSQSYRKMSRYASELNTNEKQFYNFIWKTKAFKTIYQYDEAQEELLKKTFIQKAKKRIWEKRLKKIRNCLEEEVAEIRDEGTSCSINENDAKAMEENVEQVIKIKLRKKNHGRNSSRRRGSLIKGLRG